MPALAPMSRSGTTIGGWCTIRYLPSTSSQSFDSALKLSRVRAFAATLWASFFAVFTCFLSTSSECAAVLMAAAMSCCDNRAYQTSVVDMPAKSAIAVRYAATDVSVASRISDFPKPLLRPAIVKLAAIRFTSYSKGPGRVSSKSFRSNTSVRSGDPYTPKFERCASPHSWASRPAVGVSFRSSAMILAAPR